MNVYGSPLHQLRVNFWLSVIRFAYRRMADPIGRLPVGIPANRDPDHPCAGYTPRKRLPGDAPADCWTDGHYLCDDCIFAVPKEERTA